MKRKNKWFIIYLQAERLEDTQNENQQSAGKLKSVTKQGFVTSE